MIATTFNRLLSLFKLTFGTSTTGTVAISELQYINCYSSKLMVFSAGLKNRPDFLFYSILFQLYMNITLPVATEVKIQLQG